MAHLAEDNDDLLITSVAIMLVTFYLCITKAASIRVPGLAADSATATFDKKPRHWWITKRASSYILMLLQFARATTYSHWLKEVARHST